METFRAAPNYLKYKLILWGFGAGVGIMVAFVVMITGHFADDGAVAAVIGWVLLVLAIPATAIKYFLIRIDYDMRYYVVTDRSLRIREGALIIHEATYTFANVQNLKIHQGPLERLLGISNLVVETAGGAGASSGDGQQQNPFARGHQGVLRGIVNAREVRDQILVLLKKYRDAGLGDPEDRRKAVLGAPGAGRKAGFSPAALERLREIHEEARGLRAAL